MSSLQHSRLPVEIISKIVEEVATSDDSSRTNLILHQISLVSRGLWDMAQRHLFRDIILNNNTRKRMSAFQLLSGPRGKRRCRYIRCLYLFECIFWLQSPGGVELLSLIAATAPNIRVLHIGYNFGYLDWATLCRSLQDAIVNIMFGAKKIILEGLQGFPLQYFRVFLSVQTLDLSNVALSPLPLPNTWVTVPAPGGVNRKACSTLQCTCAVIPAPTFFAVHGGISKADDWPDALDADPNEDMFMTLDILKRSNMMNFSNVTTLYLSSAMDSDYADLNDLHREIIAACAKTLQTLRLRVCSTGTLFYNNP